MEILDNVLKDGREGIKQNLHNSLDEFCETYADDLWKLLNEILRLQSENATLHKRLLNSIELPSVHKGTNTVRGKTYEWWALIQLSTDGHILVEEFESEDKANYYLKLAQQNPS